MSVVVLILVELLMVMVSGLLLDANCTSQSSTDTIHWTLRTVACANFQMHSGEMLFLEEENFWFQRIMYLQTSTDAIHWTLRTRGHAWTCTNSARYIDGEFLLDYKVQVEHLRLNLLMLFIGMVLVIFRRLEEVVVHLILLKLIMVKQYLITGDGGARVSTSTDFLHWNICCVQDCGAYGGCSGDCDFNYCWWTVYKSNLTDYPNRYFMSGYGYNQMAISDIEASGTSGGGGSAGQAFLYNLSLENVSKKEGLRVCVGSGGKGGGRVWDASNYLTVWTRELHFQLDVKFMIWNSMMENLLELDKED